MDKKDKEIVELKKEVHNLNEKLESYIPRRRVRRLYKSLKAILEQDIEDNSKIYIKQLKDFINIIEKKGHAEAGPEIKTAIEHLLGGFEINEE